MEATESRERRRRQKEDEPDPPKDEGTRSTGDTGSRNGRKEEGFIRTIRRAFFGRVLGNLRYESALQLAVSSEAAFLQGFSVGPTHHSPLFRRFLSVLSLSIN